MAKSLTDKDEAYPDLTALTEGTVAAIFAHILYLVEVEIEIQEEGNDSDPAIEFRSSPLREMVLASAGQVGLDCGHLRVESGSDALEALSDLIDALRDRILWDDRDYLVEDAFLDLDPNLGGALKEQLGIPDDYFSAAPTSPLGERSKISAPVCAVSAAALRRGAATLLIGWTR